MKIEAASVEEYLARLPEDRRTELQTVRETMLNNLDSGYREGLHYGMISYCVPHAIFPPGYHCDPAQPLPFAMLAAQKNHLAVYLMSVYGDADHEKWFRREWAKTGKKLDMGKSCVRFKKAEDLALEVIGESIRRVPAKAYVERYQKVLAQMGKARPKPAARKKPPKSKR